MTLDVVEDGVLFFCLFFVVVVGCFFVLFF